MQTYSAYIGLEASLVDFARTKEQADRLLVLQNKALGHFKNGIKYMEQFEFKNPKPEEEQAFKKLNDLIAYCNKFAEIEAYEAIEALNSIKLPLASHSSRLKKQKVKTWFKQDFIRLLKEDNSNSASINHHFENIDEIASALLKLSSN